MQLRNLGDAHCALAVDVTAYHVCEALRGEGHPPRTCCMLERQSPDPVCMALQPAHAAEGAPRISEKEPDAVVHIPQCQQQPAPDECHTTMCNHFRVHPLRCEGTAMAVVSTRVLCVLAGGDEASGSFRDGSCACLLEEMRHSGSFRDGPG